MATITNNQAKTSKVQQLPTTHNTVNKLEQLSKRHHLNFDKLANYVRLEYGMQTQCKTLRHFVSNVEQDIVVNNNNIKAMLK